MQTTSSSVLPPLDLDGCSVEPIRVPGSIQPHGWLVAFAAVTGRVVAYSDNWETLTGFDAGAGQIAAVQVAVDALRPIAESIGLEPAPTPLGVVDVGGRQLDASCHRSGALILIELEVAVASLQLRAPIYALARRFVPQVQGASSLLELAALAAAQMKELTGFGRCLVYAFDDEGHGDVLAERLDAGYASYLGHRFPASDIPAQARDLYLANHIRLIRDAAYLPSPVRFVDPAWGTTTLDLSFAQLRSVSPVHLEYMRNMGTYASMSVSIVVRGRLWGLISCHHHEPKGLDFQTRAACEHLGGLLSLQIEAKEDNADVESRHEMRSLTMQIVSQLGDSEATLQSLLDAPGLLLKLARAGGAAVVYNDRCWTVGNVPSADHIAALAAWIGERGVEIYESESLVAAGAPSARRLAHAAGALAISLSQIHRHLVIWFRPERIQSIRWAGDNAKQIDDQGRLHPRRSFHSWEEIVRDRSLPWKSSEVAGVGELRQSLIGLVLRHTQERADAADRLGRVTSAKDQAEQADSDKTHFLAVLSHELRTPLTSIANAAELLGRYADVPAKFASLVPMIKRNVALETRLINDLLDLSAISARKLNLSIESVDMHLVVRHVDEMLRAELTAKDLLLTVDLRATASMVMADPVRMQQVLWNILRNAIKFTPPGGRIDIGSESTGEQFLLTCTDNGIGIDVEALHRIFNAFEQVDHDASLRLGGLGLGLSIAMGVVQGHGGQLEASSDGPGFGSTFTLRLPLKREPGVRGATSHRKAEPAGLRNQTKLHE